MASGITFSLEELSCAICFELFVEPVTLPCGHSFCCACMENYWKSSEEATAVLCPTCREVFTQKPKMKKSVTLANFVSYINMTKGNPGSGIEVQDGEHDDLTLMDVNSGDNKKYCEVCHKEASKLCVNCEILCCEKHVQPHQQKRHEVVDPGVNMEDLSCTKHGDPIQLFCEDDESSMCIDGHQDHKSVPLEIAETELEVPQFQSVNMASSTVLEISWEENLGSLNKHDKKILKEIQKDPVKVLNISLVNQDVLRSVCEVTTLIWNIRRERNVHGLSYGELHLLSGLKNSEKKLAKLQEVKERRLAQPPQSPHMMDTCDLVPESLAGMTPLFFSFGGQNYARYLSYFSIFLANVDSSHLGALTLIRRGAISVARSFIPGNRCAVDKTMEETFMRHAKSHGGAGAGISGTTHQLPGISEVGPHPSRKVSLR
uniref:E3 ubiquitin-protein ligase Midline-1-like n=1 Tax=Myxine glutinosa TaxID=7769 RepID=UPI00358FA880